jgi:hypothetical protein
VFEDALVVKRLIRKSKAKLQRGGKIVPQKETLRKTRAKNPEKLGWISGLRVAEQAVELAQPIETKREVGCGGWI